jgi:hypothetical protein
VLIAAALVEHVAAVGVKRVLPRLDAGWSPGLSYRSTSPGMKAFSLAVPTKSPLLS